MWSSFVGQHASNDNRAQQDSGRLGLTAVVRDAECRPNMDTLHMFYCHLQASFAGGPASPVFPVADPSFVSAALFVLNWLQGRIDDNLSLGAASMRERTDQTEASVTGMLFVVFLSVRYAFLSQI